MALGVPSLSHQHPVNKNVDAEPLDGHNQPFLTLEIDAAIFVPLDALILSRFGALGGDFGPCLDGLGPKSSKIGGPKWGSFKVQVAGPASQPAGSVSISEQTTEPLRSNSWSGVYL